MKGSDINNAISEATNYAIIVELKSGKKFSTTDYRWDTNKRGEPVLVVLAGREIKK